MWGYKVASISGYGKGKLLLSMFMKGFYIFDIASGSLKPLHLLSEDTDNLSMFIGKSINLYQDNPESVLMLSEQVYRYHIPTNKLNRLESNNVNKLDGAVLPIMHTQDYTYFHDYNKIYKLDKESGNYESIYEAPQGTTLLSISDDGKNNFWVGTNRGLYFFNMQTGNSNFISDFPVREIRSEERRVGKEC